MLEDAYANLAAVPVCIKTNGESVGQRDKAVWSEFCSW